MLNIAFCSAMLEHRVEYQMAVCMYLDSVIQKRPWINSTLGLPDPVSYPQTAVPKPFVFVADEAVPLRESLLKPYPQ